MPYLLCVINVYRHDDPSTFASDEERALARQTMHYLFDVFSDAERGQDYWTHHTCCDWSPSRPLAVDEEPACCPLCGEPITWVDTA